MMNRRVDSGRLRHQFLRRPPPRMGGGGMADAAARDRVLHPARGGLPPRLRLRCQRHRLRLRDRRGGWDAVQSGIEQARGCGSQLDVLTTERAGPRYTTRPLPGIDITLLMLMFSDSGHRFFIREKAGGLLIGGADPQPLPADRAGDADNPPDTRVPAAVRRRRGPGPSRTLHASRLQRGRCHPQSGAGPPSGRTDGRWSHPATARALRHRSPVQLNAPTD